MDKQSFPRCDPPDRQRRRLMRAAFGAAALPLAGCGGGGGGPMMGGMGGNDPPFAPPAGTRALPVIPLDAGTVDNRGVREFELRVQRGSARLLDGFDSSSWGYNGPLLGPALRLRRGEATRIRVHNQLGEATTVHWHGLVVPAEADGGPHQLIAPGARWEANFAVDNPAMTAWFHPHAHGSTGRQVVMGLAGLLIVDDPAVAGSGLPEQWGVDDLALVLQDKRFAAGGQIDYTLGASDQLDGYAGDRLLVNGIAGAVWQASAQWLRLRLLNGCNARALALRVGDSLPLLQIANEGGLLAAPLPRSSITLWPGERAELLVDLSGFAIGQEIPLRVRGVADGMGMAMGHFGGTSEVTAMTLRMARGRQPGAIAAPPMSLPAPSAIAVPAGASSRSFTLGGGMMGGAFTIDGRSFEMGRIDFTAPRNTVEVWRFVNMTMMAHPMHVHGAAMSLLSRDGRSPAPQEAGQRDTFVVEPMQTVALAVRLPSAPSSAPLMVHCHNLEHEGAGMMAQFVVR